MKTEIDFKLIEKRAQFVEQLVESFTSELEQAIKEVDPVFTSQLSEDRKLCEIRLDWGKFINLDQISFRFGIIVHSLRAILDNLVFAVITGSNAKLSDGERKSIYFPLLSDGTKWEKNATVKLLKQFSDAKYLNLIKHLQPFSNNVSFANKEVSPLSILHQLNNYDKHRSLHLVKAVLADISMDMKIEFLCEEEAGPPEVEIFKDVMITGGVYKSIRTENSMRRLEGNDDISLAIIVEDFDLNPIIFAQQLNSAVQTIILNFVAFNDLESWK